MSDYTSMSLSCGDQVCTSCGQVRDLSEQGVRWNLSVEDNGSPGGQGPCGDHHVWVEAGRLTSSTRWSPEQGRWVTCWYGVELRPGALLRVPYPEQGSEEVRDIPLASEEGRALAARLERRGTDLYIRPEWAPPGHCGEPVVICHGPGAQVRSGREG